MPFKVWYEKSFAVVSFAGVRFQTTAEFGRAIERHQKTHERKKKAISKLLHLLRIRRKEKRDLKWQLACAEIRNRELEGKRKNYWRRRNNG